MTQPLYWCAFPPMPQRHNTTDFAQNLSKHKMWDNISTKYYNILSNFRQRVAAPNSHALRWLSLRILIVPGNDFADVKFQFDKGFPRGEAVKNL